MLDKKFGDSFFILDVVRFKSNIFEFLSRFREIYPRTHIGYSFKTNYIPLLCRTANNMGEYAEVVSNMEYELALGLGIDPGRIILNGPSKSLLLIEKAMVNGSILNADSLNEVSCIKKIAGKHKKRLFQLGLRCNIDFGDNTCSRFGIDAKNGDLGNAYKTIDLLDNCHIAGFHCHSSQRRDIDSFRKRTQILINLADEYFTDSPPDYIDLGGGFYGNMPNSLKKQFPGEIPSFGDYAETIAPVFFERYGSEGPVLFLEPGVGLTADIMFFAAKILDIKNIGNRKIAFSSGSATEIKAYLSSSINPPMKVCSSSRNKEKGVFDITGYTCMEKDILYNGYAGVLGIGDYVVFSNVGAYSVVMKPPFIKPASPILVSGAESQEFEVAREGETLQDVFRLYRNGKGLKGDF